MGWYRNGSISVCVCLSRYCTWGYNNAYVLVRSLHNLPTRLQWRIDGWIDEWKEAMSECVPKTQHASGLGTAFYEEGKAEAGCRIWIGVLVLQGGRT